MVFPVELSMMIEHNIAALGRKDMIIVTTRKSFFRVDRVKEIFYCNFECGTDKGMFVEWSPHAEFYFYQIQSALPNYLETIRYGHRSLPVKNSVTLELMMDLLVLYLEAKLSVTFWPSHLINISVEGRKEIMAIFDSRFCSSLKKRKSS
jgi:hypothetical protein